MSYDNNGAISVPSWVPDEVRNYLLHTEYGQPIRALARQAGVHASTILRQVRKIEGRRDDLLMDGALAAFSPRGGEADTNVNVSNLEQMQALRRLAEPGALMAIARDMDTGVIVRDGNADEAERATNLEVRIARALAVRDWIAAGDTGGRVVRYRITPAGRAGLRELVALSENRARELAEAPAEFRMGKKVTQDTFETPTTRNVRMAPTESPVHGLARRKDKEGNAFLNRDMVRAAERLREEFELAHIGQSVSQDWNSFLTAGTDRSPGAGGANGSRNDARARVDAAFEFMGPGLAEVAYRCCCLLEGLEATEQRMGWSARSGKIVLRIALQRLVLHYKGTGQFGPKIG